jgi:hypothetical protein
MKLNRILLVASTLFLTAALISCGTQHKETSTETADDADEWPELDEFHTIMADVYHPLKDSGNVQPIMERAEELAVAAEKWADAKLPEKVDTPEMKEMLDDLKKSTRALANEIKDGAPEDQAGTTLGELHDLFHRIQEGWYGGGESEGEHHH